MRLVYRTQRGFTLIEIILTLVITSVFASMLYTYMYNVTKSNTPITNLQNVYTLQQSMENIIADYNVQIASCSPSCTSAVLTNLQTHVTNGVYGTYTVSTNSCINLSSGTEVSSNCTSANSLLKVVIKDNTSGATLGALFTY
jgi:prepilin-type N-terminal cleavage/methylation domain-containing protein